MTTTRSGFLDRAKHGAKRAAQASAILALVCLVGGGRAQAHEHDADNPNPALYELDAHPKGHSQDHWAEEWWRWVYSIPEATNPVFGTSSDFSQHQRGPVYFLSGNARRAPVTVTRGKAIAYSLSTVLNDYPCPDPTFKPAPGQSLFDFLIAGARDGNKNVASIDVSIDGQALVDLMNYRVDSDDIFHFTGDISMQPLDGCVTGMRQQGVVDAYIIMLKPLSVGPHVLISTVTNKAGQKFGPYTININVVADGDDDDDDK
jgi:choline dehydrogenase-like flavoprotein